MSIQRVLLIDDDPIQNMINSKLMMRSGFCSEVAISTNGKEALDKLNEDKDGLPDIIFLDINMPIISGWDFLELISPESLGRLPRIFMLTSSISPDDIRRSESHPYVKSYLTKPLSIARLEDLKRSLDSD
jgi:CheY-like chemotaxis protein